MHTNQQDGHWLLIAAGMLAGMTAMMLAFAGAYVIVMTWDGGAYYKHNEWRAIFTVFGLAILINLALVFIHEMGHGIAAWATGRLVHIICVGYVGFAPQTRRFFWLPKAADAEYAGFVSVSPSWGEYSRAKTFWVSAGGPLATGLTGLALLMYARGLTPDPAFTAKLLGWLFIMDFVMNLVPLRWARGSASDGMHIMQTLYGDNIWNNESWAETRLAARGYSKVLVSDEEWTALRPIARQAFFGGPRFLALMKAAAAERGDAEVAAILGG